MANNGSKVVTLKFMEIFSRMLPMTTEVLAYHDRRHNECFVAKQASFVSNFHLLGQIDPVSCCPLANLQNQAGIKMTHKTSRGHRLNLRWALVVMYLTTSPAKLDISKAVTSRGAQPQFVSHRKSIVRHTRKDNFLFFYLLSNGSSPPSYSFTGFLFLFIIITFYITTCYGAIF